MALSFLDRDSPLRRTAEGTGKMRARTNDIAPKLRAVLFLIDGERTYGELLDRSGALRDLLDSQLRDLITMGLIEVASADGGESPHLAEETAPLNRYKPKAQDLPPVVAAKMQLLLRLETIRCDDVDLLGAQLLEAKTLKELAVSAKAVAEQLKLSASVPESERFWKQAKEILTAWRDMSAKDHA